MMEERLVKGEYCLSTSGVGSPPHSLPSTSGTQNDKIEDVHCACISKLETQVEEQVTNEKQIGIVIFVILEIPSRLTVSVTFPLREFAERISFHALFCRISVPITLRHAECDSPYQISNEINRRLLRTIIITFCRGSCGFKTRGRSRRKPRE